MSQDVQITRTGKEETIGVHTVEMTRERVPLFAEITEKGKSLLQTILTKETPAGGASSQGVTKQKKEHPFRFDLTSTFQTVNVHHSRCLHAKVGSTVGLGFESEADRKRKDAKKKGLPEPDVSPEQEISKVDLVLNPLTEHSWTDVLTDVCEDYWQTGNGYLEVVRSDKSQSSPIKGIFHIPAPEVFVVVENDSYDRHYEIQSNDAAGARRFAKFGDLTDFLVRQAKGDTHVAGSQTVNSSDTTKVSEVIHFRRPTSLSRWYGFPDWLAGVAAIELMQCLLQFEYDFFLNRGVPEFMLFILGQKLTKEDNKKITDAMQSAIGLGNSHKSLMLNLQNPQVKIQLEKLALESKSDGNQFATMSDSLALQIVSAHGVPPLLAGIQIPGKLGATNELVQAMTSFQALVVSPAQRIFEQKLNNTLGKEDLGLTIADFKLNTLLDEIDLGQLDTISRMRQSPQEAAAQGRDIDDGVLKEGLNKVLERLIAKS